MGILVGIELRRRDGRNPELHDQKPAQFEISRPLAHLLGPLVALRQLDLGEVGEHEVASLGLRIGEAELVEDFAETCHFGAHFALGLVPKALLVCLFEADGCGFLEGTDAAVADTCVGGGDVFDKVFGADEPADAPACGVEVLACGADGEGQFGDFWGESGNAGERDVVKAVVDFVGEDDDVVFDAQGADGF